MENKQIKTVDEYIANAPKEAQLKLRELREVIKSIIPQVEEEILWEYPFFKYHGILAGITTYKKHVSFQVANSLQTEERKMLEEKGYTLGEKRIQIKFDQKVPITEIKRILKAQAKMNEAKRVMK